MNASYSGSVCAPAFSKCRKLFNKCVFMVNKSISSPFLVNSPRCTRLMRFVSFLLAMAFSSAALPLWRGQAIPKLPAYRLPYSGFNDINM